MTSRAFIFDLDGVLIDSEGTWAPYQQKFSTNLFGQAVYSKIGSTVGIGIDVIYENARKYGFSMDKKKYYEIYDRQAALIYRTAKPTADINRLITYLKVNDFRLGLVSSSRRAWIDCALSKLNLEHVFDYILSLNDEPTIKPKPCPDGYLKAMDILGVQPEQTVILEDSDCGITSASKSGAYVIGYTEHLPPGYPQRKPDVQANNVREVIRILESRLQHPIPKKVH